MKALCEVVNVVRGDTGDADPAVFGEVDVVLADQLGDLLRRDAKEGEHANLVRDVVPVEFAAVLADEQVLELRAHAVDSIGHALDFAEPVRMESQKGSVMKAVEGKGGKEVRTTAGRVAGR